VKVSEKNGEVRLTVRKIYCPYNTVGGKGFSEQDIWTFLSKNAPHAQVWHKNADITGRAFVANDDRLYAKFI
jgi:hypothetical protein